MADIQSVHTLITQFNSDIAAELLPPNVARKIVNLRADTAGDTGFLQNIKGNTLVRNDSLPDGEFALPDYSSLSVGDLFAGGIIADISADRVLILLPTSVGGLVPWESAMLGAEGLQYNGYSDWRLPTTSELQLIRYNIYLSYNNIINLSPGYHWSEDDEFVNVSLPSVGDVYQDGVVVDVDAETREVLLLKAPDGGRESMGSWTTASRATTESGWALPSQSQLQQVNNLYQSHNGVAQLQSGYYWTDDVFDISDSSLPSVGDIIYGGIVADVDRDNKRILILHEEYTHGLVNYYEAQYRCMSYNTGGYTDWRLPTSDEIVAIKDNIYSVSGLGNEIVEPILAGLHWTKTVNPPNARCLVFGVEPTMLVWRLMTNLSYFRAVRVVTYDDTGAWASRMDSFNLEYKPNTNQYYYRGVRTTTVPVSYQAAWATQMSPYSSDLLPQSDYYSFRPVREVLLQDSGSSSGASTSTSFNRVIGWAKYHSKKAIIYFVYNSLGEHSIWMYSVDSNKIVRVLQQNYPSSDYWSTNLNFSLDSPITHANVIGDILYWVDKRNYPGKINLANIFKNAKVFNSYSVDWDGGYAWIEFDNVNALEHFKVGMDIEIADADVLGVDGTYVVSDIDARRIKIACDISFSFCDVVLTYPVISLQDITNYNIPPSAPVAAYGSDEEYGQNNLRGKTFQFALRYVYDDDSVSVLSPYSASPVPVREFDSVGEVLFDRTRNNYIEIQLGLGHSSVSVVEILVREGNYGTWGIAASINKRDEGLTNSAVYSYRFYNNVTILPYDQVDAARPFDSIPIAAATQEFVDDKYLVYGYCYDGRDNIPVDVDLSIREVALAPPALAVGDLKTSYLVSLGEYFLIPDPDTGWYDEYWEYTIDIPEAGVDLREVGDVISVVIDGIPYNSLVESIEQTAYIQTIVNAINNLQVGNLQVASWAVGNTVVIQSQGNTWLLAQQIAIELELYERDEAGEGELIVSPGAKFGCKYRFGLVYYDELMRPSSLQRSDDCEIYIPFVTNYSGRTKNDFKALIDWAINHDPPEWAVAYRWAFTSNIASFVQYVIAGIETRDGFADVDRFVLVDIEPLNRITDSEYTNESDKTVAYPNSAIPPYQFNTGDRIRFITQKYEDEVPPDLIVFSESGSASSEQTNVVDLEILGYYFDEDVQTNKIMVQYFDFIDFNIDDGSLVEIYTPVKENIEDVYYELPALYRVYYSEDEGKRIHGSQINTGSAVATGTFGKLDVFSIHRAMSKYYGEYAVGVERWNVESRHFNDFYKSDTYDLGFANMYNPKAKAAWRNIIRRSNQYFPESSINGLSSFEATNYEVFSSQYGSITGLAQIGFTLSVIQEHKLTSVYIGRAGLYQAQQEGQAIVASTTNVFGTSYRSEDEYGCQHPESILKVNRYLYYYDMSNQAIIRKAANGNTDITKYGVKKDIIQLSDRLKLATNLDARVVCGYDATNDEVLFSFVFYGSNPESHTFVFSESPALGEDANRWKAQYTLDDTDGTGVDGYCDMGSSLIAFLKGDVWLMNSNSLRLDLFGIPREAYVELVVNKEMMVNKLFRSIAVISNDNWSAPDWDDIEIPSIDLAKIEAKSRLLSSLFKLDRDGKRWTEFKKNAMTTSAVPNQKDLLTGKDLQGRLMLLRLKNSSSSPVYLKSVIVNCSSIR